VDTKEGKRESVLFKSMAGELGRPDAQALYETLYSPKFLRTFGNWTRRDERHKSSFSLDAEGVEPDWESVKRMIEKDRGVFSKAAVKDFANVYRTEDMENVLDAAVRAAKKGGVLKEDGTFVSMTKKEADKAVLRTSREIEAMEKTDGGPPRGLLTPVRIAELDLKTGKPTGRHNVAVMDARLSNFDVFGVSERFTGDAKTLADSLNDTAKALRTLLDAPGAKSPDIYEQLKVVENAAMRLRSEENLRAGLAIAKSGSTFDRAITAIKTRLASPSLTDQSTRSELMRSFRELVDLYLVAADERFYPGLTSGNRDQLAVLNASAKAVLADFRKQVRTETFFALNQRLPTPAEMKEFDAQADSPYRNVVPQLSYIGNWLSSMFTDVGMSKSPYLQAAAVRLNKAVLEASDQFKRFQDGFKAVSDAYVAKFGRNYKIMFQQEFGDTGDFTGYMVTKYKATPETVVSGIRNRTSTPFLNGGSWYVRDLAGKVYDSNFQPVTDPAVVADSAVRVEEFRLLSNDEKLVRSEAALAWMMYGGTDPNYRIVDPPPGLTGTDKTLDGAFKKADNYREEYILILTFEGPLAAAQFEENHSVDVYKGLVTTLLTSTDDAVRLRAAKRLSKWKGGEYIEYALSDRHVDPKWAAVQADPVAKEYYEFAYDNLRRFRNLYPTLFRYDGTKLGEGYIPEMQSTMREEMVKSKQERGLWKAFAETVGGRTASLLMSDFKDMRKAEVEDPVTGESRRKVPIYMQTGKKDKTDMDTDLSQALETFAAHSFLFRAKTAAQSDLIMFEEAVNAQRQKDAAGNLLPESESFLLEKQKLQHEIRSRMGDNPVDRTPGRLLNRRFMTPDQVKLADELEGRVAELDGLLAQEQRDEARVLLQRQKADAERELSQLGRHFDWVKPLDQLIEYTRLKALVGNVPMAVSDWLIGAYGLIVNGVAGQDFTLIDALKGLVWGTRVGLYEMGNREQRKYGFLMTRLGIEKDPLSAARYGRAGVTAPWFSRNFNKNTLYLLQRGSQMAVASASVYAHLKSLKVSVPGPGGTTVEVSLWDAYDADGKWMYDKDGVPDPLAMYIVVDGVQTVNPFLTQVAERIHKDNLYMFGNLDHRSPTRIRRTVGGRMFFLFRSWIASTMLARFGGEKMDYQMGRKVKGRYITLWDWVSSGKAFRTDGRSGWTPGALAQNLFYIVSSKSNMSKTGMSEVDYYNMRRNIADLLMMSILYGAVTALSGLEYEEEEEEGQVAKVAALNQLARLQADVLYYTPLSFVADDGRGKGYKTFTDAALSQAHVVRSGMQIMDLVSDGSKLALGKEGLGWYTFHEGKERADGTRREWSDTYQGKSRTAEALKKTVPIVSGINQTLKIAQPRSPGSRKKSEDSPE